MTLKYHAARSSCLRAVKLRALATLALLTFLPATASAEVGILSPPHDACGSWVAQQKNPGSRAGTGDRAWVAGFLSGLAMQSDTDFLRGLDGDAVYGWLATIAVIIRSTRSKLL
jgi:hypothetical protein